MRVSQSPLSNEFAPRLTFLAGAVVLFLLPIKVIGQHGVAVGALLGLLLLPAVWGQGPARIGSGGKTVSVLAGLTLVTLALGPLLPLFMVTQQRSFDFARLVSIYVYVGTCVLTIIFLVWLLPVLGVRLCGFAYAGGMLVQALADRTDWQDNPWKYALGWPISILLLTICTRAPWDGGALLGIIALSILADYRSLAGIAAFVAVAGVAGKLARHAPSPRQSRVLTVTLAIAAVLVISVGVSWGTKLASNGDLGSSIQQRTLTQTANGQRSVIVGARYEWAGAANLMRAHPWGIGAGVAPSYLDIRNVKAGLVSVGAGDSGVYVDRYLLGGHIEFHSIISDFWVNFGLPGLVLAIMAGWFLVSELLTAAIWKNGLIAFACVLGVWDLLFSPLSPNLAYLVFPLGAVLTRRLIRDAPTKNSRSQEVWFDALRSSRNRGDARCGV